MRLNKAWRKSVCSLNGTSPQDGMSLRARRRVLALSSKQSLPCFNRGFAMRNDA